MRLGVFIYSRLKREFTFLPTYVNSDVVSSSSKMALDRLLPPFVASDDVEETTPLLLSMFIVIEDDDDDSSSLFDIIRLLFEFLNFVFLIFKFLYYFYF